MNLVSLKDVTTSLDGGEADLFIEIANPQNDKRRNL